MSTTIRRAALVAGLAVAGFSLAAPAHAAAQIAGGEFCSTAQHNAQTTVDDVLYKCTQDTGGTFWRWREVGILPATGTGDGYGAAPHATAPATTLPVTGPSTGLIAAAGAGLVVFGLGAWVATRRRSA